MFFARPSDHDAERKRRSDSRQRKADAREANDAAVLERSRHAAPRVLGERRKPALEVERHDGRHRAAVQGLSGQLRAAHQRQVDRARALTPFANRPDDQRLAAPRVAGGEYLGHRRAVVVDVRAHVAARVALDAELVEQALPAPARESPSRAARDRLSSRIPFPASRPSSSARRRTSATRGAPRSACRRLPLLPSKRLVATAQSRSQPSSCDDDVRSFTGQYGHTSGLFSRSGGCGRSSNCVTDFAPCRIDVPTQSEPVSPPPITTTCLPAAEI